MKNFLKLTALMSLVLLSNCALYSASQIIKKQVAPKKVAPFSPFSKPTKSANGYKTEFIESFGKDLQRCNPAKRQLILALVESDMTTLKKHITPQNVNDVFEVRSMDRFNMGRIDIHLQPSLIKIPYLGIALDAYYEAPNKQTKEQALLVIKELLKLGANPNKARAVMAGFKNDKGEPCGFNMSLPVIHLVSLMEDPVLFELFLQHKGNLNAQACVSYNGAVPMNGPRKQCFTLAQQVKSFKNPKMKALAHKYANAK